MDVSSHVEMIILLPKEELDSEKKGGVEFTLEDIAFMEIDY